jgi:hypothetical protein
MREILTNTRLSKSYADEADVKQTKSCSKNTREMVSSYGQRKLMWTRTSIVEGARTKAPRFGEASWRIQPPARLVAARSAGCTELTAQVKWVGKDIHFPSVKAWSIYLNQNLINMVEELLQFDVDNEQGILSY